MALGAVAVRRDPGENHLATAANVPCNAGPPGETRPRVALFTDSFQETNGVGTLCREYAEYARETGTPLLVVACGERESDETVDSVREIRLKRGLLSFPLDSDLRCDPALPFRVRNAVAALAEFRPDVVQITGPGDVSILGRWAASRAGIPAMASWHTNVHDYSYQRLRSSLGWLPLPARESVSHAAERATLWATANYYRTAHYLCAPNPEMVDVLRRETGRPVYRMEHGVNTRLFAPARRSRAGGPFRIGYVGRLTPEKNVRAFAGLEQRLAASGLGDFRIIMVGEGAERPWLKANVRTAELRGILRGEQLAREFADMDAFVFPSVTDTFGLVLLEAMASSVPVVTSVETGSRVGIVDGVSGILCEDLARGVQALMQCAERRAEMGAEARRHACTHSWSWVFDDLYRIHQEALRSEAVLRRMPARRIPRAGEDRKQAA